MKVTHVENSSETPTIPSSVFEFLNNLKKNNSREWMEIHRETYLENETYLKNFYRHLESELNKTDAIEKMKIFRIHRDLRFTPDKTPYNIHRSVHFKRAGATKRGGYYLRLQPGNSFVSGGFFAPEKEDLFRIRKEFEIDAEEIRAILNQPGFKKSFGGFVTENAVKTAPRGFDKDHKNVDLIRLKSFVVRHRFTDKEVLAPDFAGKVMHHFQILRPFFDYMSEVLTTDLNGESILDL